jgi:hypothetical protein
MRTWYLIRITGWTVDLEAPRHSHPVRVLFQTFPVSISYQDKHQWFTYLFPKHNSTNEPDDAVSIPTQKRGVNLPANTLT